MRALLLVALLALPAFAQETLDTFQAPATASALGVPTLAGANTFLAANRFSASLQLDQGQKLSLNGATETKYLSSDGTVLTLTGLNFLAPIITASAASGVQLNAGGGVYAMFGNVSSFPGMWFGTTAAQSPSTSNYSFLFDGTNTIVNSPATLYLRSVNSTKALVDSNGFTIGSTGTAIQDSYAASASIDFAGVTDNCEDSSSITVTGAAVNDVCEVGPPATLPSTGSWVGCRVTATDTVVIRHCAHGASGNPAAATYSVRVFDP